MTNKVVFKESIKLEKRINSSLLSEIYKAKIGNYNCVVKVPKQDKEEGLEEEIRIYEDLGEYSGLVKYLGVIEVEGKKSLVLDYFDGQTIEEKIRGILSDEDIQFNLGIQFLKTLDYIMSKGIYYKDEFIKNVMVNDSGKLKIIDFNFSEGQEIYSSYYTHSDYDADDEWKNDIIHTGDFLYFLFSGVKPRVRYNQPVEKVNSGVDKNISGEVDRITQKCWKGDYMEIKDVFIDFKKLNELRRKIPAEKKENFINNNNLLHNSTKNTDKIKVDKMVDNNDITGLFRSLGELVQSIYDIEKNPAQRKKVKRSYEKQGLSFSNEKADIGYYLDVTGNYHLAVGKEESKKVHLLFVEETSIDNLIEIAHKNVELNENLNFWGKREWYFRISRFKIQKKRFFSKYDIGEGISYLNVSPESLCDNLEDGITPLKPETDLSEFESLISFIGRMSARNAKRVGRQVLKIIKSTPVSDLEKRPYTKSVRNEMLYVKVTEQEEWDKNHQPDFSSILKYFTESNGANNN